LEEVVSVAVHCPEASVVQWKPDVSSGPGAFVSLKKLNVTPGRGSKLRSEGPDRSPAAWTVTDASPVGCADATPATLA
jgi:hypothetical protein